MWKGGCCFWRKPTARWKENLSKTDLYGLPVWVLMNTNTSALWYIPYPKMRFEKLPGHLVLQSTINQSSERTVNEIQVHLRQNPCKEQNAACTPSHQKLKTSTVQRKDYASFSPLQLFSCRIRNHICLERNTPVFKKIYFIWQVKLLLSVLPEAECLWLMQGCLLWNNRLQLSHHQHSDQTGISGACLPKSTPHLWFWQCGCQLLK